MRLPLALIALLGAGCAAPDAGVAPEESPYGEDPPAELSAAESSPRTGDPSGLDAPRGPLAATPPSPAPAPTLPPPTGPIDQLFRAPADPNAPPPAADPPGSSPPIPLAPQTSKPAPPPPPPPRPRPRPWGDDPCPPCGMG